MLRVCEKLREVDARTKRLGLVRTETDYLHALLDAMANMDRLLEVEALKSLGDVNLEKGRLGKDVVKLDRAMVLYRTALLRCEDADIRESLEYRNLYVEKLRVRAEKGSISSVSKEPSLARMAEKFAHLDLTVTADYNKDALLIEYTKLMIEGIVSEDKMLEVEAIKSLGDVYLKRGTETRQTTCLTKATALYNTALARCEGVQGTVALIQRLLYTARIRQGMGKTGNKSPKHSGQLNRSHHLSRDLPGTSRSSDAMAGTTCQQFGMSSAAYIASQTPRHTTPDYRSYEEHLTTGDRALTDGKLDLAERKFASALKLIHDRNEPDRPREADCLSRLGDVYVKTGKSTKDGRKFTQAAALYNAAMARTKSNKHKVMKSLHDTEQSFLLHTANVDSKPSPPDLARRHQKRLADMRARVKSLLEAIDQQHNPYQYDEDDPAMVIVEAKRAEAVKALCKAIAKDRQLFIQALVDESIGTLGPPPCKYAFIGLGSQATELVTPYSDLEFAILIEEGKDSDDTRRYLLNLTHYLNLKVINLGETILPAMAIPSLNDFQSEDPEKDWFFDSVTPHGFAFDGFMPWASKTPFGRDKTKTKPPVSLIQTPAEMAKFQQLEVSLSEGYHLSDMLRRFVFLAGDEELVNQYRKILMTAITDDLLAHFKSRRLMVFVMQHMLESMGKNDVFEPTGQLLNITRKDIEKIGQIPAFEPTGQLLNVKKDIYRFPGIAIELLALYCNITLLASTWNVIDEMKEAGWIHEEDATHLTVLTSISAEVRLRTYMANGGQKTICLLLPR
ncbi:Hypp2725 [Branchiostoma lanceolatum]|uniref:Hypp2725 protein n=1 Tax=Branchiostoma lanceolatum TaxID=7740 RepID=A0A8J9ZTX2_BRALA|nr:Hypp2725 [Branchiostoma lanceolatum]